MSDMPADELIECFLGELSLKIKEVEKHLKKIDSYTTASSVRDRDYCTGKWHAYKQLQESFRKQWYGEE